MDRPIPKVLNFELFQRQACTFVLDVFELGSALRYAVRGDEQDSHLPKEQQRPAFLNKVRDDACVPPTGPNCRAVRSPAWTDLHAAQYGTEQHMEGSGVTYCKTLSAREAVNPYDPRTATSYWYDHRFDFLNGSNSSKSNPKRAQVERAPVETGDRRDRVPFMMQHAVFQYDAQVDARPDRQAAFWTTCRKVRPTLRERTTGWPGRRLPSLCSWGL